MTQIPVRVVAFNVEADAYRLIAAWAELGGHELALVVTTPGPSHTDYAGHEDIVAASPRDQDILVTTRLKRAAPMVAACTPDIIISYTFPYRLPASILAIPRLGAVNLHPSPLPRYRGPNAHRMLYEGCDTLGATLHRTSEGFDTGAILSRQEVPLPADLTIESVSDAWNDLLFATLSDGMERALAGDPGAPQLETEASYAASFTPEEYWLDWNVSSTLLQRRTVALNLLEPATRAMLSDQEVGVLTVRPLPGESTIAQPGAVLAETTDGYHVATGDGVVEVRILPTDARIHVLDDRAHQLAAHIRKAPGQRLAVR